jgi:DsbC/DsbD-like thiol-disulfide interchange protein
LAGLSEDGRRRGRVLRRWHPLAPAAGLLALAGFALAQSPPAPAAHARVTLGAETRAIVPGQTLELGLREEIQSGWHTYWLNPGDSGLPTTIDWHLPPGFAAGPIAWPTPERLRAGSLVSYVYSGDVVLPVSIAVPADLAPGTSITLTGRANWLVCAEICVPEAADLALTLPVTAGSAAPDPEWSDRLRAARAATPGESRFPAAITVGRESIALHLDLGDTRSLRDFVFFPADAGIIDNDAEQRVRTEGHGITISLARGELKAEPLQSLNGVLVFRDTSRDGAGGRLAVALSVQAP